MVLLLDLTFDCFLSVPLLGNVCVLGGLCGFAPFQNQSQLLSTLGLCVQLLRKTGSFGLAGRALRGLVFRNVSPSFIRKSSFI